jgi:CheY-like chemotaxis protein
VVHGDYVELAVTDTGAGIEAHVLDRMFEPFFTTKEVGKGSGMGLATVHGIAHEHRGHVVVDSVPGQGSTFRVLFPVTAGADGSTATAPESGTRATAGRRRLAGRVLVVEDDPMIADYLRELLAGWGLDVTVMEHALAAETWYGEDPQRVNLVITDQTMPRRTGLELARAMTLHRPEMPVFLHTGNGEDIASDVMMRSGVAALLRKPVDPDELLALLHRHLPRGAF